MKMAPWRHMGAQESVLNICIVNVIFINEYISKLSYTKSKSKHIKLYLSRDNWNRNSQKSKNKWILWKLSYCWFFFLLTLEA